MSRQLAWSVVADGGTDLLLVPLIQWAVHRLDPAVEILEPEFRKRKGSVAEFLATYRTGAMLIFAHRDAENLRLDERRREFETLERQDVVPVVPVRMSESWLLFDGPAIAKAAGAPSSQVHVPDIAQIENIPDPKDRLDELLFQAAGAPVGRRGRIFRRSIARRRVSVAEYISDYSPLENVPAFRSFQEVLAERYPYSNRLGQ